jgi:hypothetical protein
MKKGLLSLLLRRKREGVRASEEGEESDKRKVRLPTYRSMAPSLSLSLLYGLH